MMSEREKEIEKIAKIMCGGCPGEEGCLHCLCADWYNAEKLYNAGYRLKNEIVEEVFGELLKIASEDAVDDYMTSWEIEKLRDKYRRNEQETRN